MRIFYRFLFWLVVVPSLAFMMIAAIADGLAWKIGATLDALKDKGWPK